MALYIYESVYKYKTMVIIVIIINNKLNRVAKYIFFNS